MCRILNFLSERVSSNIPSNSVIDLIWLVIWTGKSKLFSWTLYFFWSMQCDRKCIALKKTIILAPISLLNRSSISERVKKELPGYITKDPTVLSKYHIRARYSKRPTRYDPIISLNNPTIRKEIRSMTDTMMILLNF